MNIFVIEKITRVKMKFVYALLLTGLLLAGCGKETEQKPAEIKNKYAFDSTDIKTSAVKNPNEAFNLSYKFEKGKEYNYRLTTITKDDQTIKADTTISQGASQNIVYLIKFKGVESDSEASELQCTITSIKLEIKGGNQNIAYESGKADSANKAKFADYEALVNNPFSLRVSKSGEVVDIFRVDKIVNKFLSLKGYADSANAEQKNMLKRDITEGAIKQLMSQIFREVPQNSLAKDSSWSKVQQPSRLLVFTIQNTNTYKIVNLEMLGDDKLAVVDAGLITKLDGETRHTERGVSYNFKKPVTNATGKIYFNLSDGMIQKAKTRTQIHISYDMEANSPMGKQKGTRSEVIENVNIVELL